MSTPVTGLDIDGALALAIGESVRARGISTPNPPVGAVILDAGGDIAGRGATSPPGGPHAEIVALAEAGERARGGTAVVTLEPCDHTGRTGPCSRALIAAGVSRVAYAASDPNPLAAGGARTLREAGVDVVNLDTEPWPLREWLFRQRHGRPMVTVKLAATVDGRIAAPDGTSRWITSAPARERAHAERAALDAIIVGTGTVVADDPALTARRPDGSLYPHQPTRIVLGHREIGRDARVLGPVGQARLVRSHDPFEALAAAGDAVNVQVEGGAVVIGSFLAAGLVDRVQAYIAPVLLGAGTSALTVPGVGTLTDALRMRLDSVEQVGEDVLLTLLR